MGSGSSSGYFPHRRPINALWSHLRRGRKAKRIIERSPSSAFVSDKTQREGPVLGSPPRRRRGAKVVGGEKGMEGRKEGRKEARRKFGRRKGSQWEDRDS